MYIYTYIICIYIYIIAYTCGLRMHLDRRAFVQICVCVRIQAFVTIVNACVNACLCVSSGAAKFRHRDSNPGRSGESRVS